MSIKKKSINPLVLALSLLVASLSFAGEPIKFEKPHLQDLLEEKVIEIFDNSCAFAGCHAGPNSPKDLDLSEELFMSYLVNVESQEMPALKRIKPGDPANSYLIMKLKGDPEIQGERMPKGSKPLTQRQLADIEAWVKSLKDAPPPPLPKAKFAQAFPGWSLANLPTAETLPKGAFLYRIAHRFRGPTNAGFDQLFGLDGGSRMLTQLAFPITNDLAVSVQRQGFNATFELGFKYRFLREKKDGSMPISAAVYAGFDWETIKGLQDPANSNQTLSRTAGERFHYFGQVALTKQLGDRLALLVTPGVLLDGNVALANEKTLFTVGLGGRFRFLKDVSFFVEAVPILSGDETASPLGGPRTDNNRLLYNDTFTIGIERKVGGHVFHVVLTNSAGQTTNQYMSGGEFDFAGGDFRLGFNIYRILNYPL